MKISHERPTASLQVNLGWNMVSGTRLDGYTIMSVHSLIVAVACILVSRVSE